MSGSAIEPIGGVAARGASDAPLPSVAEVLAQRVTALRYEDLPAPVLAAVKRVTLDTIACAIAGVRTEAPEAVVAAFGRRYAARKGGAAVWGRRLTLSAAEAALVNGTAAHARELDDFGGCGHSGAVVVPAVLAAGEEGHITGRDFVVGIVAGYEVAARALDALGGYARHNATGWHSTGTCGGLGATAGVARALSLEEPSIVSALGIAASFVGGIWAFIADGAMTKRLHPGRAAQVGVQSAWLAKGGLQGPKFVFETPWGGFLSTYGTGADDVSALTNETRGRYRILESGLKPYASCRGTHSTIEAVWDLMDAHEFGVDDVAEVRVHGDDQTVRMLGSHRTASVLDAQFSIPYCVAVAMLERRASVDLFDPPRQEPTVRRLMDRVNVIGDQSGEHEEPEVEVILANGAKHRLRIEVARGDYRRPLTDDEVNNKARSLAEARLGRGRYAEFLGAISDIGDLPDVATLAALTRPS
jgi:2-methylcitrate dehydratase PrpD